MKKNLKYLLALCLTIALVFSLAACGQKADETPNDAQDDQQTEQEEFTPRATPSPRSRALRPWAL